MKRGILYIATAAHYVAEAIASAESVAKHMPDIPRCICTDRTDLLPDGLFQDLITLEANFATSSGKIGMYADSPYDQTLFLDSDTVMIHPCYDTFDLLDHFEMAAAHAPVRHANEDLGCPECFPELNTGVMAYQNTERVQKLFERWNELFYGPDRDKYRHDQPAFRQALYESDLRIAVLPSEYNLRPRYPWFAGKNAKVKIIHARGRYMRHAIKHANARNVARVGKPPFSMRLRQFIKAKLT